MKDIKKTVISTLIKAVEGPVEVPGWPPDCTIIFYQPKRAKKNTNKEKAEEK